jgi:hypothetical protein
MRNGALIMEKIITDYELLNSYSSLALTDKVREFLGKGFQPHGNPFMVRVDGECVFYQAVIKSEQHSMLPRPAPRYSSDRINF